MKKGTIIGIVVVIVLIGIGYYYFQSSSDSFSSSDASEKCLPRDDDPNNYLLNICEYIINKKLDVSPAKPEQYNIKKIQYDTFEGKDIIKVHLDCCNMGDIASIEKETGKVINFMQGPK